MSNLQYSSMVLRKVENGKIRNLQKVAKTSTFWGKNRGVSCGVYAP